MAYRLTRHLPDGTVKSYPKKFKTRRDAARTSAYVLARNGAADRKDAVRFASRDQGAAVGTTLNHRSGCVFTVEMAGDV
jgi:hypothetical protein